jgi:hypothetical protein
VGLLKSLLLQRGVRVRLHVGSQGLRMRIVSRLFRRDADKVWEAPWTQVRRASSTSSGFSAKDGKISPVRLTNVCITTINHGSGPRTVQLRLQTNSPDGLVETVSRWGRG